jgi:hypothetical protein
MRSTEYEPEAVRLCLVTSLAFAALSITPVASHAIPPNVDPPTENYWRDACESASVMPDTPEIERVIDATAFIVDPTLVDYDFVTDTYVIESANFTSFDGKDFTASSLFYNEPVIFFEEGHPGRSAFLVSPDSVVTAPHTDNWDVTGYYVLFDYESVPDGLGNCLPADLSHHPASKVRQIVSYYNGYGTAGDHLVAKLDSPMLDRRFLRARRDGHAEVGDHVTVVGHPARLAKKFDTNAHVVAMQGDDPLVEPVHLLRFSSGSPLYNLDREYVETAVAFAGGCAVYECAEPLDGNNCTANQWNLVSQCPAQPAYVNSSIKPLTSEIEPIALEVSPLSLNNIGTPTDGFEFPLTTYTLAAPADGSDFTTEAIDYEIEPPDAEVGGPALSIVSDVPLLGTITAGKDLSFDVAASMPASQPCGIYPREFLVHDRTHGFTDRVRQTLEVGQTAFSIDIDPQSGPMIELQGIEQPYEDTQTLTIRNLRPTTASIRIHSNKAWLRINGVDGTPSTLPQSIITLPADQTATVVVGLSPAAAGLALHETHNAQLIVESATGVCNLTPPITRRVAFRPGHLTLRHPVAATVPEATMAGGAGLLESTLTVKEDFCVSDVKISYVFDHANGSFPISDWLTESRWRVKRPSSRRWLAIWDHNILPACDRRDPDNLLAPCYLAQAGKSECEFDGNPRESCQVLSVGDVPRPALADCVVGDPSCEPFENAIGQPAEGLWTLALEDRVHGGVATQPLISGWVLDFTGTPDCSGVK